MTLVTPFMYLQLPCQALMLPSVPVNMLYPGTSVTPLFTSAPALPTLPGSVLPLKPQRNVLVPVLSPHQTADSSTERVLPNSPYYSPWSIAVRSRPLSLSRNYQLGEFSVISLPQKGNYCL